MHDHLPKFIRLPKAGTAEHFTGLSRAKINQLILPSKQFPQPRVASVSVKEPHQSRGVRLVNLASLLSFLQECKQQGEGIATPMWQREGKTLANINTSEFPLK